MARVYTEYQERRCEYPGCIQTFIVTNFQGARRFCRTCGPIAAAEVKARHKPIPKGYRVYPSRVCENTLCGQTFDPVCARQVYCCRSCRYVGQRAQRLADVLMRFKGAKAS